MGKFKATHLASAEALRAAAARWDDLWLRSEVKVPVARAEAVALWVDHFACDCKFAALCVEEDGQLVAALPLFLQKRRHVNAWRLPGNEWSPAGDLLLDPNCNLDAALDVLVELLSKLPGLLVRLDAVVIDSPRWQAFQAALRGRGLHFARSDRFQIGRVRIGDDWQAYMESRSGNHRRHMRKALARAGRRGALELASCRTAQRDDLAPLLRQAFEIEDLSWKGRDGTSVLKSPGIFDFFLKQAELLSSWKQCELLFLKHAGQPIAFEYGWTAKQTYFSPKVGYDESFEDVTPGQLLRYLHYEQLHSGDHINEVDYMGPLSSATAKWATSNYTIGRLLIAPDRAVSRLAIAGYQRVWPYIRTAKSALASK